jgi:hypothetical protein
VHADDDEEPALEQLHPVQHEGGLLEAAADVGQRLPRGEGQVPGDAAGAAEGRREGLEGAVAAPDGEGDELEPGDSAGVQGGDEG